MSQKKPLRLSTKPEKNTQSVNSDDWVKNSHENDDISNTTNTKRITFEVSEQQHRATKILAAQKGMTIKELMHSLLITELNKQG
jgi:predicted DNA binding CopG/RHH family protein